MNFLFVRKKELRSNGRRLLEILRKVTVVHVLMVLQPTNVHMNDDRNYREACEPTHENCTIMLVVRSAEDINTFRYFS